MALAFGDPLWWHYRWAAWQPGDAEAVHPMRAVEDTDDQLVAWLAPGTAVLKPVLPDGADVRSAPVDERFSCGRSRARTEWHGAGILRIAPTGRPWSVSLFWASGWEFAGWYVNLEQRQGRDGAHVYCEDHVLDVWIDAGGEPRIKDEDELASAVLGGRFTAARAEEIRTDAASALRSFTAGDAPFRAGWEQWRPPPTWTPPALPADSEWDHDLTAG